MSELISAKIREIDGEEDSSLDIHLPVVKSSSGASFYAKFGRISELEQYAGETESLNLIYQAAPGLCPKVLSFGTSEGRPYFISEYKDVGGLSTSTTLELARRLSLELHKHQSYNGKFGFEVPTFCGATRLANGWYDTWEECYDARIAELLDGLSRRATNEELCRKGNEVRDRVIPHLLRPLKIEPVILHGDLWVSDVTLLHPGLAAAILTFTFLSAFNDKSGNVGIDQSTNEPVIYDPSSFYGHNEADLAIARIFGGFSSQFFEIYHDNMPKSDPVDQYELRVDLYELFHYLNHALLFGGGGYAASAMQKMNRLLRLCP